MVIEGYLGSPSKKDEGDNSVVSQLTKRQRQVLQLLAEGKSCKEVGTILNISTKTAETHCSNPMPRISYHSVIELVRCVIRKHII